MSPAVAVVFDNPAAVFFPGQTITGHIQVSCQKAITCCGIEVEFAGYSSVHWTENEKTEIGESRRSETRCYKSFESYYKVKNYVFGNGSATTELPVGVHIFNFNFLLPQRIPSSFESHIGKVRHHCKAVIHIPWSFNKTCLRPYSINALFDLNMEPQSLVKIECNKQSFMCCLWCKSGPLTVVLRVDRSGYVPGEHMVINAEISNMTSSKVKWSSANIMQIATCYAGGKRRIATRKVAEVMHPEIPAGDDDIWSNVSLLIPPLPASRLEYCHNIDIDYQFKFELNPSGCHTKTSCKVPMIIGSIPLRQYFNVFANAPPPNPGNTDPVYQPANVPWYAPPVQQGPGFIPAMPSTSEFGDMNPSPHNPNMPAAVDPGQQLPSAPMFPGAQVYPEMPLPSYNACMFGTVNYTEDSKDSKEDSKNNKDEKGQDFAPQYVSYSLVNK